MITIETTIEKIISDLNELKNAADQYHIQSINGYPENYIEYDQQSLSCREKFAYLSTILHIKYVEFGISSIDNEMACLKSRLTDLEDFYFCANENDKDALETSLKEIRDKIWQLKKEKKWLISQPFDINTVV